MKTGRTEQGAQAAASHSGALATKDRIVDAALRQYGVVRASTLEDFIGMAKALAWLPAPRGNRVGIVTLSGAMGVMAVDEMQATGLTLARFSPHTVAAVSRYLPDWQPVRNPADVWMALSSGPEKAHAEILGAVLKDPGVDMLLSILLPIPNADFAAVRRVFLRLQRAHRGKPIVLVLVGGRVKERWLREIEPLKVPVYADPVGAVRALEAVRFAGEQRRRVCPDPNLAQLERRH
jgi:acetyltransferase